MQQKDPCKSGQGHRDGRNASQLTLLKSLLITVSLLHLTLVKLTTQLLLCSQLLLTHPS